MNIHEDNVTIFANALVPWLSPVASCVVFDTAAVLV